MQSEIEYRKIPQEEVWDTVKTALSSAPNMRTFRFDFEEEGTVNIYAVTAELIEIE